MIRAVRGLSWTRRHALWSGKYSRLSPYFITRAFPPLDESVGSSSGVRNLLEPGMICSILSAYNMIQDFMTSVMQESMELTGVPSRDVVPPPVIASKILSNRVWATHFNVTGESLPTSFHRVIGPAHRRALATEFCRFGANTAKASSHTWYIHIMNEDLFKMFPSGLALQGDRSAPS